MEFQVFGDICIIIGLSILILSIFHRFEFPPILGFFVTGMLIGPYGIRIIDGSHGLEIYSEIGIILLLFTIGVELSLKELWEIKKAVLLGGALQILFTTGLVLAICTQFGFQLPVSIFIGFLVSLSSTAIVLGALQEKGEIYSPHGRTTLAMLIFQDIIVVPMILVTPLLAGVSEDLAVSFPILFLKGLGIILLVLLSARYLVPRMLYQAARAHNRETFLLTVLFICLSTAVLTSAAGLSLALGAFLAGLVISESEYSHQALGNVIPFRDVFLSFFFISVGMLLDVKALLYEPQIFFLATGAVILLKIISGVLATFLLGYPLRTTLLTGFALSQVGEFSFVLSKFGLEYGLLDGRIYQVFLAVSVLSMGAAPFIINLSPKIADFLLEKTSNPKLLGGLNTTSLAAGEKTESQLNDHLIIAGFGFNGRTVSKVAKAAKIPYIVLEMNPDTVRNERKNGESISYGDGTSRTVLEHVGIKRARVLVIGISDPVATRKIVELAKRLNPNIHIIARTRFLQEMDPLHKLGAEEVIPEEYETSVEIFVRLLNRYLVPKNEIEAFVSEIRADGYEMLRELSADGSNFNIIDELPGVEVHILKAENGSALEGKTLANMNLRKEHGVTVLAIRRGPEIIHNPVGETLIQADDVCILLGEPHHLYNVKEFFE
ncbi:MAG: cation:proton antiporter [Methanosarcinaceae archaeon]|nr:cation:proton antiporter [Methanosarcinaceae archaeon]